LTYLLDVNVLISLIDPAHVHHPIGREWFFTDAVASWATCPIVENGVVRIVSNVTYPNSPGGPSAVIDILRQWRLSAGHEFWPDDISIIDDVVFDARNFAGHKHITDTYLLALAAQHRGRLATFDRRISVAAVPDGAQSLFRVPTADDRP
jgi:toxin-antitoxin system PIN domain toxin